MEKITVWTKQSEKVWENLQKTGRHVARKEYVHQNEDSLLMIQAYDWLVQAAAGRKERPADADYPVWVSFRQDATMLLTPGTVMLELEVERDRLLFLNVEKWTAVNNCAYIPMDEADRKRHEELLELYGISDLKACTTAFYPEIRREIENSWSRAFEDTHKIRGGTVYGLLWEIQKDWVKKVSGQSAGQL